MHCMQFIKRLLGMSKEKAYKVQDKRNPPNRCGVMVESLEQLKEVGCKKLNLDKENLVSLKLEDGTLIEEEKYFQSLKPQTVIIFLQKNEGWSSSYDYLKLALDKLMADSRDAVIEEIQNTLRDYSDNKKLSNMMNNMLKDLTQNIEAENYEDDPDWFEGLENIPKKDKGTKSDVMRYQAKQRIKSYYSKLKENIEISPKYGKRYRGLMEDLQKELNKDFYFGVYFDRSCNKDLKCFCDEDGWFKCQGSYNVQSCDSGHIINPYGSSETRKIFCTWNLDHQLELSREIIPKMQEAIQNCPKKKKVNSKYFYELLFTTNNLKLVHICCHDKRIHKDRVVNKRRVYVNQ